MLIPIFDHRAQFYIQANHICHLANKLPNFRPKSLLKQDSHTRFLSSSEHQELFSTLTRQTDIFSWEKKFNKLQKKKQGEQDKKQKKD